MDGMEMKGTPWLDKPLSMTYREFECQFNDTALCDYESGYWRFWYMADYRFALPTVAFFLTAIVLFAIAYVFDSFASSSVKSTSTMRRITALTRFFSYRTFRVRALNWNSAPLGILILGLVGFVYFMTMTLAPKPYYWPNTADIVFGSSPPIATRSGWLSLACLPFIFVTAGKSNLITMATGVSHEKLQVFHRWISYACFVTALVHTFPFIVYNIQTSTDVMQWKMTVFYWTGVITLIAQAYLTFASIGPLRAMSYEWFKFSHFVAALVFVLFLFFHCDHTLSAWNYFIATGVLFPLSWLHRQTKIYFEHGINHRAHLSMTRNGFICVRIPTTATWGIGQHFFVRFMAFGVHMGSIHPFTACSLPVAGSSIEKQTSELVLYIRPHKGLTARLAKFAQNESNKTIPVLLDGPYGGINFKKLNACQRQLIITGGSGAGWVLPVLEAFLRRHQAELDNALETRSAKIVIATRDTTTQAWFEECTRDLLITSNLEKLPECLEVEIHYTGHDQQASRSIAEHTQETRNQLDLKTPAVQESPLSGSSSSSLNHNLHTSSTLVKHFPSRPDLRSMIRTEAVTGEGMLGVFVCGPPSMQSDVSNAVADEQVRVLRGEAREVYLHMEHFSWA